MAAVVYGGNTRQHGRLANNIHSKSSVSSSHVINHHYGTNLPVSYTQQLLPPPASYQNLSSSSKNHIIMPPPLYDEQPLSLPQLPNPASTHSPTYQQQFQHHVPTICRQNNVKRKSAVELLAESKPFYVKSENVLDRSQHLHFRSLSGGFGACTSSAINSTLTLNQFSHSEQKQNKFVSPVLSSPSKLQVGQGNRTINRRSSSNSSDLLQTKLRKLLNTDSRESDYQYNKTEYSKYICSNKISRDTKGNQSSKISVSDLSITLLSLPPNSDEDVYPIHNTSITEDFSTISPPAEYACNSNEEFVKSKYQRSCSNSYESQTTDDPSSSCHKSLPDLHSQTGISNRYSPHSEVLSCCSRGNRSNKSGGSSLNRDSGGSSGHYTHRSDPCCKQQIFHHNQHLSVHDRNILDYCRRDSGSSTQHSTNSCYVSGRTNCADCLLNFTTPEVPEAFQDNYPTKLRRNSNNNNEKYSCGISKGQRYVKIKPYEEQYDSLGNGKPILRSKSDISDRYWRNYQLPCPNALSSPPCIDSIRKSESLSELEFFFDRLGLDDEKFNEIYSIPKRKISNGSDSSDTIFFSDISTIDSSKLATDSHKDNDTQTTNQIYRPSEPTSIVERNARIIKWLCNCRKLQTIV